MGLSGRAAKFFHEARLLPVGDRKKYLEEACGSDRALLDELLSLLSVADESEDYFDALSKKVGVAALAGEEVSEPSGKIVGNWRLDRIIGRGGMGAVYLAERADGQFEQRAALKTLPFGLDSELAGMRFVTERQILASLEHSNIARLLDGGVADDGTPYFVMEYVEGLPIDIYCDRHRLNLEARLRLFIDVIAAVAHAHSQLVVHRDLKPSNVLVTDDGCVKLLDFGVAKLLADNPSGGQTRELSVAITPDYAAPEQLVGGRISTATDVYALGLLLFKLLVGNNPRGSTQNNSLAQLQQAATEAPPRPSDFVGDQAQPDELADIARHRNSTLAALKKNLRGDLDNILNKAAAVDADDRYASVRELSDDLQRFLNDEPVLAQPPTMAYRVGKFVRRHRGGVLGAALTLLALLSATAITAWQMVEANRQRDIAIYQQQRVQANSEFYSLLMEEMGGGDFTSIELLDRGRNLLNSQFGTGQPFMASVLFDVSRRYGSLGEREREAELLQEAEEIARDHRDDNSLAAILCRLARINGVRDPERAADQFAEGMSVYESLASADIVTSMECLRTNARVEVKEGNVDGALGTLFAAKDLLDAHPAPGTNLRGLLLNDISFTYYNDGRPNESIEYLDEVLNLLESTGRGSTLGYQRVAANKAVVLQNIGRTPEALDGLDDLVRRMRASGFQGRGSATLLLQYGDLLMTVGRANEAEQVYIEGLAQAESVGDGTNAAYLNRGLAKVHLANKAYESALQQLAAAQDYIDGAERADRVLAHSIRNHRAKAYRGAGNLDAAEGEISALLADIGYPEARRGSSLLSALIEGAEVHRQLGNYSKAEELVDGLIDRLEERGTPDSEGNVHLGRALVQRAEIRLESGNAAGAIPDLERAMPHLDYALGEDHSEAESARSLLANARSSF